MAKSWQYPRWRRLLMQCVMWLILGGTVGLAALVNHQIRQSLRIDLSEETAYENIIVRLPVGWDIQTANTGPGQSTLVRAVETGPSPRALSIERHRIGQLVSPEEFLFRDPLLAALDERMLEMTPAVLADRPAILVAAQFHWSGARRDGESPVPPGGAGNREPRKLLRLCTVLPSRDAIVVQVDGPGTLSDIDVMLIHKLAEAIQVSGAPWLDESAKVVELFDGTSAAVPDGFHAVVDDDPNRISRSLLLTSPDGRWACAELVPCLYFENAGSTTTKDPTEMIRTLLLSHGDEWREARVTRESPSQLIWRLAPADAGSFPRRGYFLAAGPGQGRALLVLFRAGLGNGPLIEPAWQQIRRGVRFDAPIDLAPLLQAGAEQVQRLRSLGLAELIPTRAPQWWLWYKDSADTFVGYSHLTYDPRDNWRARGESTWNRPDGSSAELIHRFESDGMMRTYNSLLQRFDTDQRLGRSVVKAFERTLDADKGIIRVFMERGHSNWQGVQPAEYVPGGWIGELMGRFRDQTVLLRTDMLDGCEDFAPASPLTVLARPTDDEELPPQERDKWPWCMTVQVNGASEVMRWHFSAEGRLEQIDQADGVHRIRSEQSTIESFISVPGKVESDGVEQR